MARIFLSYRAGEGAYAAALLDQMLSRTFGEDQVFRASRSIMPGESYADAITCALKECEMMLVLIGPDWTSRLHREGHERSCRSEDWVRTEIVTAIGNGMIIIPVLLSRASRLDESDLPRDIAPLARLQYLRFEHRSVEHDFAQLVRAVTHRLAVRESAR